MEYIDTEEQIEHCVVATNLKSFRENPLVYTHMEVDVNLAMLVEANRRAARVNVLIAYRKHINRKRAV